MSHLQQRTRTLARNPSILTVVTSLRAYKKDMLLPMYEYDFEQKSTASLLFRKTTMIPALAALTNVRPHDFHHISIAVPTSVSYSVLGKARD